jgi:hypothetical protein
VPLSSRASGGGRDRVGVACNGSAARTVRPVVKVNGGNGAPVVGGGEEEVEELLDSVGKLGVGPIGVVGAGEGCSTANRKRRWVELAGTRRGPMWCTRDSIERS